MVPDGLHTPERGKGSITTLREIPGDTTKTSNNSNQNSNRNGQDVAKDLAMPRPARSKAQDTEEEGKAKKKAKAVQKTPVSKGDTQGRASMTPLASRPEKRPKISTPASEVKKFPKVADLSALGMSPKTVAINRRNTKGETLLHVACIKVRSSRRWRKILSVTKFRMYNGTAQLNVLFS